MTGSQWSYRPSKYRGGWSIGLIAVSIGTGLLVSLGDIAGTMIYPSWNDMAAEITDSGELLLALFITGAGVVSFGTLIAAIVMVCCWMYRACANTHALGALGLDITPGWAVGWWFIPIACLFKPFSAMKEIYLGSDPNAGPDDWQSHGTPALIGWWWAAWLVANFTGNIETQFTFNSDPALVEVMVWVGAASTAISIAAGLMLIRIILEVQRRQTRKAAGFTGIPNRLCPRCGHDLGESDSPFCPQCRGPMPPPPGKYIRR